jgi:hypothetical protein
MFRHLSSSSGSPPDTATWLLAAGPIGVDRPPAQPAVRHL